MRAWEAPEVPRLPGDGMDPAVYDTVAGEVRSVAWPDRVTLYVCGITPYDATHLGHANTYLAFDTLQRVLRDAGHTVEYCQNVTDVDDPLLVRAAERGEDWRAVAERETELFRTDMTALRVLPPRDYVGAVEAIPRILELIGDLDRLGLVYDLDGDRYFPVAADEHFGELSGLDRPAMLALAAERGGDPERPGKKDPLDPLVWLAARPGEPSWPSPFGPGRPGWHIECAAIALDRLGDSITVQGGGSDLAFPHHECSAAHASAATGVRPFADVSMHAGMVGYQGEKMSKSRGNLVFVSRLREAGIDPALIRLALLAHHYRGDWEWTDADLAGADRRWQTWQAALAAPAPSEGLLDRVRDRLADDLDTPGALAAVDAWAERSAAGAPGGPGAAGEVRDLADALLGLRLP